MTRSANPRGSRRGWYRIARPVVVLLVAIGLGCMTDMLGLPALPAAIVTVLAALAYLYGDAVMPDA